MQNLNEEQRQFAGCGFLPSLPDSKRHFLSIWNGGSLPNYKGPRVGTDLTVCPGFSTGLPGTIEFARARLHWSKGQPIVHDIDSATAIGIEILEGASNEFQSWTMTPESKGGGGQG